MNVGKPNRRLSESREKSENVLIQYQYIYIRFSFQKKSSKKINGCFIIIIIEKKIFARFIFTFGITAEV